VCLEAMRAKDAASIHFTITRENAANGSAVAKSLSLKLGAETPVRIGRAPANDIIVESRGVSQYHCELRVVQVEGAPQLCIRDLSMNGTGLKKADGKGTSTLEKKTDTPVPDGSLIYVPMMLKMSQAQTDRAWLKVEYKESGEDAENVPPKGRPAKPAPVADDKSEDASDGGDGETPEENEKKRMLFVELLLKTKEVSAGTSYEDAKKLLDSSAEWHAVDDATRKECFEIFVEHLGSHSKKKDKKKGKEKEKDKSKKSKKEEAGGEKADRSEKKKHRKGASRSPSGERKHRRTKTRRGRASADSGSPPPQSKRRRRGARSDS